MAHVALARAAGKGNATAPPNWAAIDTTGELGPRCKSYLEGAELGGGRAAELQKSVTEAMKAAAWIGKLHPEWGGASSRILDKRLVLDLKAEHLWRS